MIKIYILVLYMVFTASCSQSKVVKVQTSNICGYTMSSSQEKILKDTISIILETETPEFPISENPSRTINADGVISCVLLGFHILPSGEIIDIHVMNTNQDKSFIRSSIRALKKYKFKSVETKTSGIVSIKYILQNT